MTPTSRGAFCSACAKDVVDFTAMTDDEVQHYLLNKAGEKVCGKFYNTQLNRIRINIPAHIFYAKIAGWKKFMAVVMLAFGSMLFGCDVTTDTGVTDVVKTEKPNSSEQVLGESSYFVDVMGKVAAPPVCETIKGTPAIIEISVTTTGIMEVEPPPMLMGVPQFEPVLPDTNEVYEMVGGIRFVDTTIQKLKKDSLPKSKLHSDSLNCPEQHFY